MQSNTDENEVPVPERVRPARSRRKRCNENVQSDDWVDIGPHGSQMV